MPCYYPALPLSCYWLSLYILVASASSSLQCFTSSYTTHFPQILHNSFFPNLTQQLLPHLIQLSFPTSYQAHFYQILTNLVLPHLTQLSFTISNTTHLYGYSLCSYMFPRFSLSLSIKNNQLILGFLSYRNGNYFKIIWSHLQNGQHKESVAFTGFVIWMSAPVDDRIKHYGLKAGKPEYIDSFTHWPTLADLGKHCLH